MNHKIKRGDVYMIPGLINQNSHVQSGTRPWIVVSNDVAIENSPVLLMVHLTGHIQRLDIPSHIPLIWQGIHGSMALCEQVRPMDVRVNEWEYISTLPKEIMDHIDKAITAAFFFKGGAARA